MKVLISNDKSTFQVLPKNMPYWWTDDRLESNYQIYGFFIKNFAEWLNVKNICKVEHITQKKKFEFYFPYLAIGQLRTRPFQCYISVNVIEFLNQKGFNGITADSDIIFLYDFVREQYNEYVQLLNEFYQELVFNFDKLKFDFGDDKGKKVSEVWSFDILRKFRNDVIKQLENPYSISVVGLSVTADIHFEDVIQRNVFMDLLNQVQAVNYQTYTVGNETVFLRPFNNSLKIPKKDIPKIRFYDKLQDTITRYRMKLVNVRRDTRNAKKRDKYKENLNTCVTDYYQYILVDYYDGSDEKQRFERIDDLSQSSKTLEDDFVYMYKRLQNTIRFEVDFTKESINKDLKKYLGLKPGTSLELNDLLLIDNYKLINDYLSEVLDWESDFLQLKEFTGYTDFPELQDRIKEDVGKFAKCYTGTLDDLTNIGERLNFVLENFDFLNLIHSKQFDLSKNSIRSKLKRFRFKGIVRGSARRTVLNEPYLSLLRIVNYYQLSQSFTTLKNYKSRANSLERVALAGSI